MQAIVNECNRLAREEEALERARWLKQVMLELDEEYSNGKIDLGTLLSKQDELMRTLGENLQPN